MLYCVNFGLSLFAFYLGSVDGLVRQPAFDELSLFTGYLHYVRMLGDSFYWF